MCDEEADALDMSTDTVGSLDASDAVMAEAEAPTAASPVSVGGLSVDDKLPSPRGGPETVIIFDWDDTLMASSWLARQGMGLEEPAVVPAHVTSPMNELGAAVKSLLEDAMSQGQVVIITNAETGWVEMSAAKFMPAVLPLFPKLRVVSARSTYERAFPDSPIDWKVAAFTQELHSVFGIHHRATTTVRAAPKVTQISQISRNIISFGDSVHERTAVHAAAGRLGPGTLTKSVKFVERPTAEQLRRQVELVSTCLTDICGHTTALDLMLTIHLLEQHDQQQRQQREAAARQKKAQAAAAAAAPSRGAGGRA